MTEKQLNRMNCAEPDQGAAPPRPLPVPMWRMDILTLQQAAHEGRVSEKTVKRLCREQGVGRRSIRGGPYQVSAPALQMALANDHEALELLREGRRDAPEVIRYLRSLQLVP